MPHFGAAPAILIEMFLEEQSVEQSAGRCASQLKLFLEEHQAGWRVEAPGSRPRQRVREMARIRRIDFLGS